MILILVAIGSVLTGIVVLIRHQSAELIDRAMTGLDQLRGFATAGPIAVTAMVTHVATGAVESFAYLRSGHL